MPDSHVPAVLSVLVRVQVVQHGLGTPQAAYLHRVQLAILPWLWATTRRTYADSTVLYY